MRWQPIETAPKDENIIIYDCGIVSISMWSRGWIWCENEYDNLYHKPTHWMPLPAPPVNVENKSIDTEQTK